MPEGVVLTRDEIFESLLNEDRRLDGIKFVAYGAITRDLLCSGRQNDALNIAIAMMQVADRGIVVVGGNRGEFLAAREYARGLVALLRYT